MRDFYKDMSHLVVEIYYSILDYVSDEEKSKSTLNYVINKIELLETYLKFERAMKNENNRQFK